MERLTLHTEIFGSVLKGGYSIKDGEEVINNAVRKLAEYEDTGLTPEETKVLKDFRDQNKGAEEYFEVCAARDKAITDRDYWKSQAIKATAELGEIKIAEAQGLLIKLPCKVGDTVYEANMERNLVSEYEIQEIIVNKYGVSFFRWTLKDGIYSHLTGCPIECFGKTVFLTREAAEEALKGGA